MTESNGTIVRNVHGLPVITVDDTSGFAILAFGVYVSRTGTPYYYCLVDEMYGVPQPAYVLCHRLLKTTTRTELRPPLDDDGAVSFRSRLGQFKFRIGNSNGSRMHLAGHRLDRVIEPFDPALFTLTFIEGGMTVEPRLTIASRAAVTELEAAVTGFIFYRKRAPLPESVIGCLDAVERERGQTISDPVGVPAWCLARMRQLATAGDADGTEPVGISMDRLLRHLVSSRTAGRR